ncbi:MAG TPA: efflux RND transporter periplasmic adaptor subunit [Ramlibacter sp.]|nr:efflux RND transporter periplasmic adaptor subunit [Ramlibacter sp.]
MAAKPLYIAVAAVGIAAASGAAWWYQHQPARAPGQAASLDAPAGDAPSGTAATAKGAAAPASGAAASRPPVVEVAKVEVARLVDDAQAVGTLRSRQSVMLRPEVSGRVAQINFKDGQRVRRGQLLVQLDDELPRAQVQQAQAELSIARANHKRNQDLVAQGFISQRSVDESGANVQVAQAKLSLAEAMANRLRLLAPFDGVTGIRTVSVGDYLKDGADIVNIEDLDAILVDFRLPERFQTKLKPGQSATVSLDALPGRNYQARVQAVDPLVDANGRSVGVRGCIDNRQQQLRPGMFARVTAVFGERDDARLVPEEAIVPQAGRQFVYKLVDGPDQDTRIAQRTEVKTGVRQPGKVEIVEGLQPGEVVVVAGQQRIQRDGTAVRVVETPRAPVDGQRPTGAPTGPGPAAAAPAGAPSLAASMGVAAVPTALSPAASHPAGRHANGAGAGKAGPEAAGPNPCVALAMASPALPVLRAAR